MKIKKLKGGFTPYITTDEKLLVTVSRNTAYVYDLESGKLQQSVKSLSNLSETAVSGDKKLLAVKNTSEMIALISLESWEEIGRCGNLTAYPTVCMGCHSARPIITMWTGKRTCS